MKLYVLRATKTETYDCPDNGLQDICERYEDVEFSTKRESLDTKAENLNQGHVGYWSEKRANELRSLHAGYETHDRYTYTVVDVSDLLTA